MGIGDETVQKFISDLGNEISNLFRVGDAVALLDMVCTDLASVYVEIYSHYPKR